MEVHINRRNCSLLVPMEKKYLGKMIMHIKKTQELFLKSPKSFSVFFKELKNVKKIKEIKKFKNQWLPSS